MGWVGGGGLPHSVRCLARGTSSAAAAIVDTAPTLTQHIEVPHDGHLLRSGMVLHVRTKQFYKLDDLTNSASTGCDGHFATDEELLAHYSFFAESSMAIRNECPVPQSLPLLEVRGLDDRAGLDAACMVLTAAQLGPVEACAHFPCLAPRRAGGGGARYGDVIVCGLDATPTHSATPANRSLVPITLLVKASLPTGECVCVMLDDGGVETVAAAAATPQNGGVARETFFVVKDTQILCAARGAHWRSTQRQHEARLDGRDGDSEIARALGEAPQAEEGTGTR